ncbi:hypothetical protein ERO13_D08G162001v2 [Gossypium hirsutum]|uniref:Uncharacterized protein n=1 Tax=Gossypium barbadense TaxID=3634 RepID=A0A5J5NFN5_GOSBA|nr:hypothetical protein ES319_1Z000200v1 [Gossypium barbadense]KAG4134521.1 hypothetical protein ERO13_D08G162001v2 [Gossypium hirsutum]
MLMRKCVYENISKGDIQKLFPSEVLPKLERLLTLLLQKFQREWRADVHMDKVSLPRLKTMAWNLPWMPLCYRLEIFTCMELAPK